MAISAVQLIWNRPSFSAAAVAVARLIVLLLSSGGASPKKDGDLGGRVGTSQKELRHSRSRRSSNARPPTTQFRSLQVEEED